MEKMYQNVMALIATIIFIINGCEGNIQEMSRSLIVPNAVEIPNFVVNQPGVGVAKISYTNNVVHNLQRPMYPVLNERSDNRIIHKVGGRTFVIKNAMNYNDNNNYYQQYNYQYVNNETYLTSDVVLDFWSTPLPWIHRPCAMDNMYTKLEMKLPLKIRFNGNINDSINSNNDERKVSAKLNTPNLTKDCVNYYDNEMIKNMIINNVNHKLISSKLNALL